MNIKKDYIIISSIDWSENWQMHQQLATSLVKAGNKVLFIENTGVRSLGVGDISRISSRVRNWIKSTRGFFDIQENLTVFSPIFLPFPYSWMALIINHLILIRSIEKWIKIKHFQPPIVISFLPTPLAQLMIESLNPLLTIYYNANDMSGGSAGAAKLKKYEDIFITKVDAVFCTSHILLKKVTQLNINTFLFPAGVDYEKFEKSREYDELPFDLINLNKPIIGYVGAISRVFDQKLILYVAKEMPHATFVLVGPEVIDVKLLTLCDNIKLFGKRSHDIIPSYIKGFDLALIPYVKNTFTDAVYSCKLNEYLSMGIPVIATNMQELNFYVQDYGKVLEIAGNKEEFLEKIRCALIESGESKRTARIMASKANSWNLRFANITSVISQLIDAKTSKNLDWKSLLIKKYKIDRMRLIKFILPVALMTVIVFFTPLVWFIGDQLTVRHDPYVADAIVIFSGDGESNYINQSYQRRAIDAINYYKSGFASLIILSSGRDQNFSEVEIISSLLINRGIPKQAIKIIDQYPKSTFENITLVKDVISKYDVQSVLLITSPYHSRRALWVWRKSMPEILVLAPEVVDTPSTVPQWNMTSEQIKVIGYEYLAIIYYWFKGWL